MGDILEKFLGFKQAAGAALLGAAVSVQAAVPAGVDTAFSELLTDAGTVAGYAVPVVMGILALSVVIKLIKRFGNKV